MVVTLSSSLAVVVPLCRCTAGSTSPGFPPLSLHYSQHLSHGESASICLILLYLGSSIFPDDTTIVEVNRCWQLFIFESQHLHIHYPPQCFLLLIMIWKGAVAIDFVSLTTTKSWHRHNKMEYCEKLIANSVGWKLVAQTINQAMSYISRFQTWTTFNFVLLFFLLKWPT